MSVTTLKTSTEPAAWHPPQAVPRAAAEAYLLGAAGREVTLQANERAWRQLGWLPRVLATPTAVETSCELLGRRWPTPWLAAPMAHLRLAHPDAELALALGSAAQGAGMVLSSQANTPLDIVGQAIANDRQRGPLWFQLYPYGQRDDWLRLAQRAQRAGFEAIVLTVDAPVQWSHPRARAAGFALPADWPQPNLPAPVQHGSLDILLQAALRWEDVAWLRTRCPLPLILKGILHPDDARLACERHLCDALIVSNHGGRVLDGLPPTAAALPAVLEAVAQRVPVLVDGGLRCAADVAKALALGARAVLVGRPLIQALMQGGAQDVARLWRLWRDELAGTLALLGSKSIADLRASILYHHVD